MKERLAKSIARLIVTIIAFCGSVFGFENVNSQILTDVNSYQAQLEVVQEEVEIVEEEETVEEEVVPQEEVPETVEPVAPAPIEVATPQPVYVAPVVVGDSIEVAGITRNLMKDESGEHFYLNHNLAGEYDGIGVPYVDFRHDFTGRKTIIYSHSSKQGNGPFQALQNYHNNPAFYQTHRMITIHYQGNTYNYLIFSVYVSVADSEESEGLEYFHRMNYTYDEWEETIQKYRSRSEYDTGVEVSGYDQILILQTCSMDPNYYERYYRYNLLIMGKLI